MNERIRKLAVKSGIDIRGHLTGRLTLDEKPSVADLEKFAELIVREYSYDCMDVTGNSEHIQFVAKNGELNYERQTTPREMAMGTSSP